MEAFDNVKHGSILANLSPTDCGVRTYAYVRDRQAHRIEDEKFCRYTMGTRDIALRERLQCASNKSELLHARGNPKDKTAIGAFVSAGLLGEVEELRILGLFLYH
ncbi:hypothetical protein HPB50_012686 [Hyalomma asiaticum]|uniref:Uncharacterized protein n=1 Tax=Hyalomma asiaticum TaxID=266040 RepID=A0ACB7THK0_HYAAI|nr:hypothetical protein HPB50_012686 [Hyalomma asiaticum]